MPVRLCLELACGHTPVHGPIGAIAVTLLQQTENRPALWRHGHNPIKYANACHVHVDHVTTAGRPGGASLSSV